MIHFSISIVFKTDQGFALKIQACISLSWTFKIRFACNRFCLIFNSKHSLWTWQLVFFSVSVSVTFAGPLVDEWLRQASLVGNSVVVIRPVPAQYTSSVWMSLFLRVLRAYNVRPNQHTSFSILQVHIVPVTESHPFEMCDTLMLWGRKHFGLFLLSLSYQNFGTASKQQTACQSIREHWSDQQFLRAVQFNRKPIVVELQLLPEGIVNKTTSTYEAK